MLIFNDLEYHVVFFWSFVRFKMWWQLSLFPFSSRNCTFFSQNFQLFPIFLVAMLAKCGKLSHILHPSMHPSHIFHPSINPFIIIHSSIHLFIYHHLSILHPSILFSSHAYDRLVNSQTLSIKLFSPTLTLVPLKPLTEPTNYLPS